MIAESEIASILPQTVKAAVFRVKREDVDGSWEIDIISKKIIIVFKLLV